MQGGMLLTQTLRDVAPLRASLDAVLTYVATYAADPDSAAKALRLHLPGGAPEPVGLAHRSTVVE